jgi:transcriptional regulator with XRE-family HTH domain
MPRKYTSQIKKFGSVIFEQREKNNLTQAELAKLADVDIRTIRRIEKGDFAIGLEIVLSLAKVLKVQPSELLEKVKLKFE